MMKIFILLLVMLVFSNNWISTSVLMSLILFLTAFYFKHDQDYFLFLSDFSLDSLSFSLVGLSILITILMNLSMASNPMAMKFKKSFVFMTSLLLMVLILAFSTNNLIMFYILFEASLLPTFMLILGWGSQPERSQAGIYMFLYTVLASLPLLTVILMWSSLSFSSSFWLMNVSVTLNPISMISGFLMILAFAVKLPLYMVHLWLPKAHVEAPVAGSMILAAVLLKLGGYGVLRLSLKTHALFYTLGPVIISWSVAGGVMIALVCIFQMDIKFLIALSSVAHMAMVMAGALTFSFWGVNGALLIMMGHGFCSSGLFCIANMVYERSHSRSLTFIKGVSSIIPIFALGWFMLCIANMAAPPTLNLLGEMNSVISLLPWSYSVAPFLASLVFLAAGYSLFLYSQTQQGKPSSLITFVTPITQREFLIIGLHILPLNLLILFSPILQMVI